MSGNPYSSKEPGLGPLMRDIKNKICTDCELVALLEDDSGMELLVRYWQLLNPVIKSKTLCTRARRPGSKTMCLKIFSCTEIPVSWHSTILHWGTCVIRVHAYPDSHTFFGCASFHLLVLPRKILAKTHPTRLDCHKTRCRWHQMCLVLSIQFNRILFCT